ncbi:MAG: chemotaxis protein CheW, partial [Thiohalomonadales bacterium]
MKKLSPIHLLYELEKKNLSRAKGLPQQEKVQDVWSGISFRVGEFNFVAPLDQVHEILHYPMLTTVPGAINWIKGVANVRGILIAVSDLNLFLGKTPTQVSNKSRILIYRREELAVGLLVNKVYGMKHFTDDEKVTAVKKFDESLRGYVLGAYKQNDDESLIFNM